MALKCEKLKRRLDGFELCGISADGNGIDYRCREKRGLGFEMARQLGETVIG